jgi:hypothetical protein
MVNKLSYLDLEPQGFHLHVNDFLLEGLSASGSCALLDRAGLLQLLYLLPLLLRLFVVGFLLQLFLQNSLLNNFGILFAVVLGLTSVKLLDELVVLSQKGRPVSVAFMALLFIKGFLEVSECGFTCNRALSAVPLFKSMSPRFRHRVQIILVLILALKTAEGLIGHVCAILEVGTHWCQVIIGCSPCKTGSYLLSVLQWLHLFLNFAGSIWIMGVNVNLHLLIVDVYLDIFTVGIQFSSDLDVHLACIIGHSIR